MTTDLAVIDGQATPAVRMRTATDVASVCKQIVVQTAMTIQGRKYVRVEGWQAIAIAHGCIASARDVEMVEGGVRAIGEIKRVEDGAILATAEGFVGDDESMWAKRPLYARRAMAQTRAISRACRSAFAHVVVMMAAGLETTPAEEIPHEESGNMPVPAEFETTKGQVLGAEVEKRKLLLSALRALGEQAGLGEATRRELWSKHCGTATPQRVPLAKLEALVEDVRMAAEGMDRVAAEDAQATKQADVKDQAQERLV